MRWLVLALLAGCSGAPAPGACEDVQIAGEWNEMDVSAREPMVNGGAPQAVIGHLLSFQAGRMTETWSLEDGSALSGSIGYEACNGELVYHPDPSPLAGGEIPVVSYAVNGGRLQLGPELYSRAGR